MVESQLVQALYEAIFTSQAACPGDGVPRCAPFSHSPLYLSHGLISVALLEATRAHRTPRLGERLPS